MGWSSLLSNGLNLYHEAIEVDCEDYPGCISTFEGVCYMPCATSARFYGQGGGQWKYQEGWCYSLDEYKKVNGLIDESDSSSCSDGGGELLDPRDYDYREDPRSRW